jgi:phage head maturation protease
MATQIGNIGGIDVASRRASFAVLPALDAHGTVVPASGLRLERFLANPVFCWMHRTGDTEARSADPDDVIGTVTDLRVEGDRLLFAVVFGTHDLADRCFRAVVEKRINACSISFNPIRQHVEGDAVVVDVAELIEISLVIVGSNPEALALRSFIEAKTRMNPELLKKLGLDESAGAGDILIALAQYLAKSDEDKALVDEVVKMLPEHSKASEGAEAAAQEAADEERAKRDGDVLAEVKKLSARMDEIEKRTAPASIAAAVRAAAAASTLNRAQTRSAALGAPVLPAAPVANSAKTTAKSILDRADAAIKSKQ